MMQPVTTNNAPVNRLRPVPLYNNSHTCIRLYRENFFRSWYQQKTIFRPTDYFLVFIEQGELSVTINGAQNIFTAGTLFLIFPNHQIIFNSPPQENKIFILSYDESGGSKIQLDFGSYKAYAAIFEKREVASFNVDQPLVQYFSSMLYQLEHYLQTTQEQNFKAHIINNLFSAIVYTMIDMMHNNTQMDEQSHSRKEKITMDFLELVEKEYRNLKSIGSYADRLHVSIPYLTICVKTVTQKTPSFFISNAVLGEAKSMLRNTEFTLAAIADDLHFPDPFTFGKFFKRLTGTSPGKFRKGQLPV